MTRADGGHRARGPAGRPHAVPWPDHAPKAEPQVPQRGGGLPRAHVRGPLLRGANAVSSLYIWYDSE